MSVYVIGLVLSIMCGIYAQNIKQIKGLRHTYVILGIGSFLPLALISALRYEVGTDWPIYHDYFNWINEGKDKFNEPLFNLINRIIYLFTKESYWLFAVCALIIIGFTMVSIYDQSVNIPFSILVFFLMGDYFNSQNQLRQGIAMAIFLYAMKYIESRDYKRFFMWIFIGSLFHMSALFYIPFYFLYGKKVNLKLQGLAYICCLIGLPIMQKILVFIVSKTRYSWYFDSIYNQNNFYTLGFLFTVFFVALNFYYYYYGKRYGKVLKEQEDTNYNLMFHIYYCGALSVLFSAAIPQMVRVTTAFSIVMTLLLPRMITREHKRNRRICLYFLVVFVLLVKFLYDVYHNGWYDAIPYQTIFSK